MSEQQKPSVGRIVITEKDEVRFWKKVAPPDSNGCLIWMASLDANGYGQFYLHKRVVKAHQVAWVIAHGDAPEGLEPDHLCNIRCCVAHNHLEWITHRENNRRIALRAEFCRSGLHRWTEQDLILHPDGKRECRPCRCEGRRRRYAVARGAGMTSAEARRTA